MKPKRLSPGGTIGLVAPAGQVDRDLLQEGVLSLERAGFKVMLGQHIEKRMRYFAGNDSERAEDLLSMMQNNAVDAVFCARGGSGSARIIPHLPETGFGPKIFVGGSDITTLLLYLSGVHGWVTFHGPMAATASGHPERFDYLVRVLSGEPVAMHAEGVIALKPGQAEGVLTGGCLSLICTTIGTAYEIDTADRILFIEDIGEAPYRIDRMLYYLKMLKKFNHIRGAIFGQMPGCQPELLPEIILEIMAELDVPILFGFPSGHGAARFTLPFGTVVQIDTEKPAVTMLEPAVVPR